MKKEQENRRFKVTPWEVSGKIDYGRLIKKFGITPMPKLSEVFEKNILFRRKIIFAHRDFTRILDALKQKKPFVMMTGLMPSGKFHFGHALVAKQMTFYQKLGAMLYIAVADIEAYNTRLNDLQELKKTAIEEYLTNYIALGLKPERCDFYFQSFRSKNAEKANAYYRLASVLSRYATFSEYKAIYGEITPGKMIASLLQASDMYHPQLQEFEGQIPVVIPVGIDQDPHIRIARDMASRIKSFKFLPISSTYHQFMSGLKGINTKMSSSDPDSYIALTDSTKDVERKIRRYAFSGGQATVEEHRRKGGNPDIDVSFQYLRMFFEPDDGKLKKIYDNYKSGKMLTSELKEILIEKINTFLKEHQRRRELAEKQIDKFLMK